MFVILGVYLRSGRRFQDLGKRMGGLPNALINTNGAGKKTDRGTAASWDGSVRPLFRFDQCRKIQRKEWSLKGDDLIG